MQPKTYVTRRKLKRIPAVYTFKIANVPLAHWLCSCVTPQRTHYCAKGYKCACILLLDIGVLGMNKCKSNANIDTAKPNNRTQQPPPTPRLCMGPRSRTHQKTTVKHANITNHFENHTKNRTQSASSSMRGSPSLEIAERITFQRLLSL